MIGDRIVNLLAPQTVVTEPKPLQPAPVVFSAPCVCGLVVAWTAHYGMPAEIGPHTPCTERNHRA